MTVDTIARLAELANEHLIPLFMGVSWAALMLFFIYSVVLMCTLPFAIFGIKSLLKEQIELQERLIDLLEDVPEDIPMRNMIIEDIPTDEMEEFKMGD